MTPKQLRPGTSAAVKTRDDAGMRGNKGVEIAEYEFRVVMRRADDAAQKSVGWNGIGTEQIAAGDFCCSHRGAARAPRPQCPNPKIEFAARSAPPHLPPQ